MTYIESSISGQSTSSLHLSEADNTHSNFTNEQVIEIFNAATSLDPSAKETALSNIQDEKLRGIAAFAIEGSDKNDPNQSERVVVDFEKSISSLPWYY